MAPRISENSGFEKQKIRIHRAPINRCHFHKQQESQIHNNYGQILSENLGKNEIDDELV